MLDLLTNTTPFVMYQNLLYMSFDDHVQWWKSRPNGTYKTEAEQTRLLIELEEGSGAMD